MITLIAAAGSTACYIAPAAQHRVLFRQHDKERLLKRSSRLAYAGLLVLAVAIVLAVLLVTDVLFGSTLAWWTAAAVGALLTWFWVVVPLVQRARGGIETLDGNPDA